MPIEPVEIEFIMKDSLTPGVDKAASASEHLGQTAEQMSSQVQEQVKKLGASIKQMEQLLAKLDKQMQHSGAGSSVYEELSAELQLCKRELSQMRTTLRDVDKGQAQATSSARSLVQEQRQLIRAMAEMRLAGKQNTSEYEALAQRAAALTDTLGDVRAEANALAHDNAGFAGVTSGLAGLTGGFTAATGVVGLLTDSQEKLAEMQTKLQGVMAITMGVQQALDAINEDSAFRLVALRRAKELLIGANYRLATALGISTTAATALMAALTLGASLIITGAVVAYNKYADAQAEARQRALDLIETEKSGRAEMLRHKFELDNVIKSIEEFNGTKQEEERKVKELNDKYGESFGYYRTMAEWYDVLQKKSQNYVKTLFLEAKAKSLIDKAVKADEEYNKAVGLDEGEYGAWYDGLVYAFGSQSGSAMGPASSSMSPAQMRAERKRQQVESAAKARKEAMDAANEVQQELRQLQNQEHIGGHTNTIEEAERLKKEAQERAEQIRQLGENLSEETRASEQRIQDARLQAQADGYDKERKAAELSYSRRLQQIDEQERKRGKLIEELRKRGKAISPAQEANSTALAHNERIEAANLRDAQIAQINKREAEENQKKLDELIGQHRDYDEQRRSIEAKYADYLKELEALRTADNGNRIDAAKAQANRDKAKELKGVDDAEVEQTERTSAILVSLYEDAAEKSISEIKRIINASEALMQYLKTTSSDALTAQHGISAKKLRKIKESPEDMKALGKAIKKLKGEVLDRSPIEAFFGEIRKGLGELKKEDKASVGNGIDRIGGAVQKIMPQIQGLGNALAGAFGEEMGEDIGILTGLVSNLGGVAAGIGRIMAGDVIGGVTSLASSISNIVSMGIKAEKAHQQALRKIQQAQLDFEQRYTLLLLRQRLLMEEANSGFGEQKVLKAANALKVYADAQAEYNRRLRGNPIERPALDLDQAGGLDRHFEDWNRYIKQMEIYRKGYGILGEATITTGHVKTGLFGWGKGYYKQEAILSVYPKLIKATGELDTAMLREIMATREMSDEHRNLLKQLLDSEELMKEAMKQVDDYIEGMFGTLGKSVTNALVASIRDGKDALEVFAEDASKVLENLGEQITYSLFFADRFKKLKEEIKELHKSGDERSIGKKQTELLGQFYKGLRVDMETAKAFMQEYQAEAKRQGFDLWHNNGAAQQARSSAFTTISQEQGTKLEGLFTSGQVHWASMDDQLISITTALSGALSTLSQIATNTKPISAIYEEILTLKRDGIKLK